MLNQENLYLLKFAWKSIRRNAGRSFFIGFSVSLAVIVAVWIVALFDGLNSQIERAVVNTNTGYFQVQETKYAHSTDSSFPLELTPELKGKLSTPPINSYSPELVLDGNIVTPEGAAGLLVLGIEPELHKNFLPLSQSLEGEFLTSSDDQSIVIGRELANVFKFHVGEQLVLNYQDQKGELRSEILTIKGIYHLNGRVFEKRMVYINQSTWQKLFLNTDSGKILFNRIPINAPGISYEKEIRQKLNNEGLIFKTWKNLNPEMAVVLEFHDGMIKFFFLIISFTILMTVITPVRMLWQERFKELKMMNIMGVTSHHLWKFGLFEVIQMIVFSGLFSSFVLLIIIGIQTNTGIDFSQISNGTSIERAGIELPTVIYPLLSLTQIVITFSFVIMVLGISYLWSIYKTIKRLEAEL